MAIPEVPLSCCCDWGTGRIGAVVLDDNTPWLAGTTARKMFLLSGQITTTVKTSLSVGAVDATPTEISWDGTNTPWMGQAKPGMYLQSGQFSSTIKTSEDVSAIHLRPHSISSDGNTPWSAGAVTAVENDSKLYLQSGQFTSTVKDSLLIASLPSSSAPYGLTTDGTDSPWYNIGTSKFLLQSGQFDSTIKTSVSVTRTGHRGIEWDGTNILTANNVTAKVYVYSGKFTNTIKLSLLVSSLSVNSIGISSNRIGARSHP